MKRKIIVLITALCLLAVCVSPVFASNPLLVDEAQLLSSGERAALDSKLNEISARQGLDIVVVTVDSTDGKSPMEYADDYYDYNGYRSDGILLLISMEERDWWISTTGYGITAFTDAGLDYISDRFVPYLSDGEYAEAFDIFAQLCDEFITQAKTDKPYDSNNLPKRPFRFGLNIVLSLVVGLVIAYIATASMKKDLKSAVKRETAHAYVKPGSLQLTNSQDFHLYTHLDRRERAESSSGSSTHTSSSGTVHGGRGGKF